MSLIPAEHLVFVDESGVHTAMTRLYARAPRGQRAIGAVPLSHYASLTILGALRLEGIVALATVPATTDSELFRLFVLQALVPALRPGDVVVWDNLKPHRSSGLQEAIAGAQATLLPLPPYSPDFSPMEPCWSKIKQQLRQTTQPRTSKALPAAVSKAAATITPADTRSWFLHCGYRLR